MTFLTPEETHELTGYRRYSVQRRWCDRAGVPYFTAASGRPIILRASLEQRTITRPDGTQTYPRLRLAAKGV